MATAAELKAARQRRREVALALRPEMSPTGPAPDQLRVATWNVNSLKARTAALRRFLERAVPDVVLLQETKASEVVPVAARLFDELGYHVVHSGAGAYNGVAIVARHPMSGVVGSADFDDEYLGREPRLIAAVIETPEPIRFASVYVPHGREIGHWHYDYKLAFLAALREQVSNWLAEGSLVLGGDVNVAPTDSDIFHPDAFVGLTHVTEPEREAWTAVLDVGLVDLDARRWGPRARRFTWWNHGLNYARNLGMRIDVLAADPCLAERLVTTWIDHVERGGERPSDHAALLADLALTATGDSAVPDPVRAG
ncbi:MAG: exodeoxyribonuclease III [Acidimicrobiia bacterium]